MRVLPCLLPTLMALTLSAADLVDPARLAAERVRPLLATHCLRCHGGDDLKGGLDLRTRESLLRGGDSGPAVIPGDAKRSWLYRLVSHQADPHMPHKKAKLTDAEIAAIAAWIAAGALYPAAAAAAP